MTQTTAKTHFILGILYPDNKGKGTECFELIKWEHNCKLIEWCCVVNSALSFIVALNRIIIVFSIHVGHPKLSGGRGGKWTHLKARCELSSHSQRVFLQPFLQELHLCSHAALGRPSRSSVLLHAAPVVPERGYVRPKQRAANDTNTGQNNVKENGENSENMGGEISKSSHLMVCRSSSVSWFRARFFDSAAETALPERLWASLKGTWSTQSQPSV